MTHTPVSGELRRSLATASETQVLRVVGMVDALAERGSADALIAPLRGRLALMKPARPLRFSRLLFLPLNPIIVPAAQWRIGGVHVPRSALPPISAAVQTALGGAGAVDALIAAHVVGDVAVEAAAGALLWSCAAGIVGSMLECPGWEQATGLPDTAWLEIRAKVAGLLLIAERIHGPAAPAFATEHSMGALLADVQARAPLAMNAVLSVLLAQGQNFRSVMLAASRHSDRLAALSNAAVSRALDAMPQTVAARIARAPLQDAAEEADRIVAFLAAVEASGSTSRGQIRDARQVAAAGCADRFAEGLGDEVLTPLLAGGQQGDAAMMAAEATARSLGRLANSGRVLGGGARLDGMLGKAWTALAGAGPAALDPVDRARMAEILFGPDAAEKLLPP